MLALGRQMQQNSPAMHAQSNPTAQPAPRHAWAFIVESLPKPARERIGLVLLAVLAALCEGSGLLLLGHVLSFLGNDPAPAPTPGLSTPADLDAALVTYSTLVFAAVLVIWARSVMVIRRRTAIVAEWRARLMAAVLRMDWPALHRLHGPNLAQLSMAEIARLGQGAEAALRLVSLVVHCTVFGLLAWRLSPELALTVLLLSLALLLAAAWLERGLHIAERNQLGGARQYHALITDSMLGRRLIKSMGLESMVEQRLQAASERLGQIQSDYQQRQATGNAILQLIVAIGAAFGLGIAVRFFSLNMSEALVFTLVMLRLGQSVLRLRDSWHAIASALPAREAVLARLLEAERAAEPGGAAHCPPPRQRIAFEAASYSHPETALPALHQANAEIPAGRITVVMGASGAGKSTFADLAMGLMTPDTGHVLLDDAPLDAAALPAWRKQVAFLPQDAFLFNDTIRANLLAANPEADEAALLAALTQAGIADMVMRLPQRLDTQVGELGGKLSGGEKQRIALARALLRPASLLLLDEPTSALDAANEARLITALAALRGSRTILIITHRAALLSLADHVILLDKGHVVAAGAPGSLDLSLLPG